MAKKTTYSITEITVISGKKSSIHFELNGNKIDVPIDAEVKAYFNSQFVRDSPSKQQRQKFSTIMNLMRAAYIQGFEDGKKS